jgi:hypothetical protein
MLWLIELYLYSFIYRVLWLMVFYICKIKGTLKCVGDSLHLKDKFGNGYNLSILIDPEKENIFMDKINDIFEGLKPITSDAGNLIFNIQLDQIYTLTKYLEDLEINDNEKLVKDWGISHTTLEEVYLKVTKKEFNAFSEIQNKNNSLENDIDNDDKNNNDNNDKNNDKKKQNNDKKKKYNSDDEKNKDIMDFGI